MIKFTKYYLIWIVSALWPAALSLPLLLTPPSFFPPSFFLLPCPLRRPQEIASGIFFGDVTKCPSNRISSISRSTKETNIDVVLDLDHPVENSVVKTGLATLDKLITAFITSSGVGCRLLCSGDLWIDDHHLTEDVGIALGQAINRSLGDKKGCNRMWSETVGGIRCTLDLSNRPYFEGDTQWNGDGIVVDAAIGSSDVSEEMVQHFFESLVTNGMMTCHIEGQAANSAESAIKAFGTCFAFCKAVDERRGGKVSSSKGTLSA